VGQPRCRDRVARVVSCNDGCSDSPSASVLVQSDTGKPVVGYGHVVWALQLAFAHSKDAPGSRAPTRNHNGATIGAARLGDIHNHEVESTAVWRLRSGPSIPCIYRLKVDFTQRQKKRALSILPEPTMVRGPAAMKDRRRSWGRIGSITKFAAGIVVGASLGCVVAAAAQGSRHDGAFWSKLGNQKKAAYLAGYSDATHSSLGKLDNLRLAAGVFHWKSADKILAQVARGLDISGLPAPALIAYLDKVYSNPRYGDFDVGIAIELAAMRGIDVQPPSSEGRAVTPRTPDPKR
jgi:hypothetical protein